MKPNLWPVILAGGSGTRLWPLSRRTTPKPFVPLLADDTTLFQRTLKRLEGLNANAPLIVCNETHRFLAQEQLGSLDIAPHLILVEPVGRNTAPALTLAACALEAHHADDVMLMLAADHLIEDEEKFQQSVFEGIPLAQQGHLVTFGIVPTAPATGYGYIRRGPDHAVAAFVEKPDLETAKRYVASGDYLWNSGIFMVSPKHWLEEMERFQPEMLACCRRAYVEGKAHPPFYHVGAEAFAQSPSDSIDYAIAEKTEHAAVVPMEAGWSDLGDWASLPKQDADGNLTHGDVLAYDTHDSVLYAQSRLLAAVGLQGVVAVETADAVLVADKCRAQEVKQLAERLQQERRAEIDHHRRVHKPWGAYEVLDGGEGFQVKRLTVNPGAKLSLQKHQHRSEHWVVVRGTAEVTKDEEILTLKANESVYISVGTVHRLANPGRDLMELIEVQLGDYLGEDDIVRIEDDYDRLKEN